jgi:uncharacterized protein (DUF1501 family)
MSQPVEITRRQDVSRRQFLVGAGASAAGALALPSLWPRYAFATPGQPAVGDALVVVFLRGGADGLSLVPPFSDTAGYRARRGGTGAGSIAVLAPNPSNPNAALDLQVTKSGHSFGLHPAMTGLKAAWDAGDLAIVHAAGLTSAESASRSHFEATDYWERGTASQAVNNGWLARYLTAAGIAGALPALSYDGAVPTSLRGNKGAVAMSSIESFNVEGFWDAGLGNAALRRVYTTGTIDPLVQQGADTIAAVDLVAGADPLQHDTNGGLYPTEGPGQWLGQGLREVACLLRADLGLRVACVDLHGWDHHDTMGTPSTGMTAEYAGGLSSALAAFRQDLGSQMNEVTVVTMSEFGRTIGVNGSGGTDHGRGSAMFVMGGAVNGGLYGDYPSGPLHDGPDGDLEVQNDFRRPLAEIITKRMGGATLGAVFPGYTHPGDLNLLSA